MGWLSTIWEGVKAVGSVVTSVVKKVYDVLTNEKVVDVYEKLDKVIIDSSKTTWGAPQYERPQRSSGTLDFYSERVNSDFDRTISEQNSKLVRHESELNASKKFFALQIELSRLRGSAELIDRATQNVKIHASSLSVHYQNMRNINGLIDDVNGLRYALNTIIGTINENSERMSHEGVNLRKVQGIDIEKREGAISQLAAYDAFDRTRELLRNEIVELSRLSSKHLTDIDRLKINASNFGGDVGNKIVDFIDEQLIPVVRRAQSASTLLRSEVSRLPAATRDETGRLLLQEGKIMLEQIR